VKAVGLGEEPMQADDFEAGAARDFTDLGRAAFIDISRVGLDREGCDFDALISVCGEIAADFFEGPIAVGFVAEGVLHE
jgi:hypothetical protein